VTLIYFSYPALVLLVMAVYRRGCIDHGVGNLFPSTVGGSPADPRRLDGSFVYGRRQRNSMPHHDRPGRSESRC
jgi:hypothetical protein